MLSLRDMSECLPAAPGTPLSRGRTGVSPVTDSSAWITCAHCRERFPQQAHGTHHRNHCPYCLWSRHVDDHPGDRTAGCQGLMEPLAITARADGEWVIIHRCQMCGLLRLNRIAGDDRERALIALVLRPLARPAFPLDLGSKL